MVIWMFRMIICGSHIVLIILHFNLVLNVQERQFRPFRLLPWDITIQGIRRFVCLYVIRSSNDSRSYPRCGSRDVHTFDFSLSVN